MSNVPPEAVKGYTEFANRHFGSADAPVIVAQAYAAGFKDAVAARTITVDIAAALAMLQASPEMAGMINEIVKPGLDKMLGDLEAEIARLKAEIAHEKAKRITTGEAYHHGVRIQS